MIPRIFLRSAKLLTRVRVSLVTPRPAVPALVGLTELDLILQLVALPLQVVTLGQESIALL